MESNEPFDHFINALVQFTSETKKGGQLHTSYEKLVYKNQNQLIKAVYTDLNFNIDTRKNFVLYLTHLSTNKSTKLPLALQNDGFEANLKDLKNGTYTFKISSEDNKISSSGRFVVLDYGIEEQFVTADYSKLNILAQNNNGEVYFTNNYQKLIESLKNDSNFKNIQKSSKKSIALIDWKWLLAIIIVSLSVEWFIRKYRGMI